MTVAIAIAVIFAVGIWLFWDIGWWKWFLLSFGALLGGWELASVTVTGKSLSQSFWAYHAQHEVMGWLIIAVCGLVCCIWLLHMAWKQIRRNK